MTPLLTNETIIEQFESHLTGKMSQEIREEFIQKLNNDPQWQEAYQTFLLSREVIGLKITENLRTQLKQWNKETHSNKPEKENIVHLRPTEKIRRLNSVLGYAVAAGVLFLMTFSFIQYQKVKQFTDMAVVEYQGINSKANRSEGAGSKVDQIIIDYVNKTQSSDQTINSLKQISPDASGIDYFKAQNYLGRLYLLQGMCIDMSTAYQISAQLTGYKYDGDIAQVLCELKQGSGREELSVNLKKILDNPEHTYYDQAVEIDKKINSFWWSLFN